jgi:hypothetical protein
MKLTPHGIQYDTAEEATYPLKLCRLVAKTIRDELVENGYLPKPSAIDDAVPPSLAKHKTKAATGRFVRGNRLPQVISEFSHVELVPAHFISATKDNAIISFNGHFAKILRQVNGVENNGALSTGNTSNPAHILQTELGRLHFAGIPLFTETETQHAQYVIGVFRTPQQFAEAASSLVHPIDMDACIPDCLRRNIFFLLCNTPGTVARFRLERIKELVKLGEQLHAKNEAMLKEVPAPSRKILENRNLALFDHLIQQSDYPDKSLVSDIIKGMQLTGDSPRSEYFEPKLRPATLTAQQLKSASKWMRRATAGKVRSSGNAEIDNVVWTQTLDEASPEKGWLSGPFTEHEVTEKLGHCDWICSRRFGINQGNKIRCIDDFSESSVNAAISTYEKVSLDMVDDFVGVLKFITTSVHDDGAVSVKLSDGRVLSGRLPAGTSRQDALKWVCKTFDLKSAYRQLPTRIDEAWLTNLAVYDPINDMCKYFMLHALPFGAIGAVNSFNRLARALWAVGASYLSLVWTDFYDDYSVAEPLDCALFGDIIIKKFFKVLGWQLALEEKKCRPFDFEFAMLGVVCSTREMHNDVISVSNKPERIASIVSQIDGILSCSTLCKQLASELKGKCQFASNQVYGRIASAPLHALNQHVFHSFSPLVTEFLRSQLVLLKEILTSCVPRTLCSKGEKRPILVFSDGACEGKHFDDVSVGAVVFDTIAKKAFMFGSKVPDPLVQFWKSEGKIQTIGQAELLPVVLAKIAFEELIRHRRVFYLIDNDSARMALIRGCSDSLSSMKLINVMIQQECKSQSWAWFARVPTHSNPGDGPSRLRLVPHPENLFAEAVPCPPISLELFGDERLAK